MTAPDPRFLSLDDVVRIHEIQIDAFGGSLGLRDRGLLESAVNAPRGSFGQQYLCADLFEMAAALLFSIVKNHPFIDGNKRTGTVAAIVFLRLNGIEIAEDEPALGDLVLAVASGQAGKAEVAEYFRRHVEPLP